MDPLSASVSVLSVLQVVVQAGQAIRRATRTMRYAAKERREAIRDLRLLEDVLDQALSFLDFDVPTQEDLSPESLSGFESLEIDSVNKSQMKLISEEEVTLVGTFDRLSAPLLDCKEKVLELQSLCEKDLTNVDTSSLPGQFKAWFAKGSGDLQQSEPKRARVWWLTHKDKVTSKLRDLRTSRDALSFAILVNTSTSQASISRRVISIEKRLYDMDMRSIYTWLKPPEPKIALDGAVDKFADEEWMTGQWLLDSDAVRTWTSTPGVLVLRGKPGAGKVITPLIWP